MPHRASFLILLVVATAIPLGVKLLAFRQEYARPDDKAHTAAMKRFMQREGFAVTYRPMLGRTALEGTRAGCRIAALRMDGRGDGRDRFIAAFGDTGSISYAYRGRTHGSLPRWQPLLEEQSWQMLQPLTGGGSFRPLIAFARTGACPDLGPALSDLPIVARTIGRAG